MDDVYVAVAFFVSVLIGLVSVAYFVYAEYRIGALCSLCTGVHLCVVVLLPLSWKIYRLVAPAWKWTPGSFARLIVEMRITLLVALLLVGTPIISIQVFSIPESKYPAAEMERFGRCLTQKGFVLYTQEGCGLCDHQKATLAGALPFLKNVHCTAEDPGPCVADGVQGFPTWKSRAVSAYQKPMHVIGFKAIDWLSRISGCLHPQEEK